jgi:hypothetical protein
MLATLATRAGEIRSARVEVTSDHRLQELLDTVGLYAENKENPLLENAPHSGRGMLKI